MRIFIAILFASFATSTNAAEKPNVAKEQPEIAEKIGTYLKTARTPSPEWEPKWQAAKE